MCLNVGKHWVVQASTVFLACLDAICFFYHLGEQKSLSPSLEQTSSVAGFTHGKSCLSNGHLCKAKHYSHLGYIRTLVYGENIKGPTVCHQRQLQRQGIFIQQNRLNLDVWFCSLFWWNLSNWKCQKLALGCNMSSQDAWLKSFSISARVEFVHYCSLYNN